MAECSPEADPEAKKLLHMHATLGAALWSPGPQRRLFVAYPTHEDVSRAAYHCPPAERVIACAGTSLSSSEQLFTILNRPR
jgi:hypothetical protein